MNWTYSIKNKFLASAALLSLCFLVLFSNYIDRDHTDKVKNAISSLYEDRLKAEEYILKMSGSLYQIKDLIQNNSIDGVKNPTVQNLFLEIEVTSAAYHKTKFTEPEKIKASQLNGFLEIVNPKQPQNHSIRLQALDKALITLNELSAIQLSESKEIMGTAEKLYVFSKITSQFVFAIIIVILLMLQALVFASKTLIRKEKGTAANLN